MRTQKCDMWDELLGQSELPLGSIVADPLAFDGGACHPGTIESD